MPHPGDVVVFAGPCLPPHPDRRWRELLAGVTLLPPARRGDVLAAMACHPKVLVLLDGYFYSVPAVTHKELLYALESGIRVIGAASMGALRAAELEAYGMCGVGEVFQSFRSGELDGDDEVAVLHAPQELAYRPLTLALVEVRHALCGLRQRGLVSTGQRQKIVAALKRLPFTARSLTVATDLVRKEAGGRTAQAFRGRMACPGLKQADARRALERALRRPVASVQREGWPSTGYLYHFKEVALTLPATAAAGEATLLQAWNMAQLFHPQAPSLVRQLRYRLLLYMAALHCGRQCAEVDQEAVARRLRRVHEQSFGRPLLPAPEYSEEARLHLLAAAARQACGRGQGALAALARHLGFEPAQAGERLLELAERQPDLLPSWWQARAFSFTPALRPAQETASTADEIYRCFRRWRPGSRVRPEELTRLAAELWQCQPEAVARQAAGRGLFHAAGLADGLRHALQLVAVAERLPRPINAYREARRRLSAAPLDYPLGLPDAVEAVSRNVPVPGLPQLMGAC